MMPTETRRVARNLRLALLGLVLLLVALGVNGQDRRSVPLATDLDRALAQIETTLDGKKITFRGVVSDDLTICVAPKVGVFGPTRCFLVRDIRAGRVVTK